MTTRRADYDDDRPWTGSPSIDVNDDTFTVPFGFVWPAHVGQAAGAANSQPSSKETPDVQTTAPVYGLDDAIEEFAEPKAPEIDLSALVGALWDKAQHAKGLGGGELQDVLAAAGIADYGRVTAEEEEESPYLIEDDVCLRLTPAGIALLSDRVTVKFPSLKS